MSTAGARQRREQVWYEPDSKPITQGFLPCALTRACNGLRSQVAWLTRCAPFACRGVGTSPPLTHQIHEVTLVYRSKNKNILRSWCGGADEPRSGPVAVKTSEKDDKPSSLR